MSECVNVRRSECRFVVASLGRGGISEAASLGEQSWRLSAGVLGETALPEFLGGKVRTRGGEKPRADRGRAEKEFLR